MIITQKTMKQNSEIEPGNVGTNAAELLATIRPGDRVTIWIPAGLGRNGQEWKQATGTARIVSPGHVALNMGGRFGTPGVATESNLVSVRKARRS